MRRHVHGQDRDSRRDDRGVVLLITLVILVILATLGYTLSVRVAARRHRDQYIIDYDIARHACASGLKYAMVSLGDLQFQLVSRPNEPDFSDVFALSEPEYQELLTQMALDFVDGNSVAPESGRSGWETAMAGADANDVNDLDPDGGFIPDLASLSIRGPYGPPWPLVTEPIEFEVGSAKVKIEIEDENARYPLGWAMIADEKVQAQAAVSWSTFLEWMGYSASEIDELSSGLTAISTMKPFKMEFKPESETVAPPSRLRSRITRPTKGSTAARRTTSKKTVSVPDQVERQNKDFARFFHSSIMDTDLLARPSIGHTELLTAIIAAKNNHDPSCVLSRHRIARPAPINKTQQGRISSTQSSPPRPRLQAPATGPSQVYTCSASRICPEGAPRQGADTGRTHRIRRSPTLARVELASLPRPPRPPTDKETQAGPRTHEGPL